MFPGCGHPGNIKKKIRASHNLVCRRILKKYLIICIHCLLDNKKKNDRKNKMYKIIYIYNLPKCKKTTILKFIQFINILLTIFKLKKKI